MFKLIVGLFLASAAPSDPPAHVMTYNQSAFPTEEVCREFISTDEGRVFAGTIQMMASGHGLIAKFACIEAKDNTI
jgi:hypothetical protein